MKSYDVQLLGYSYLLSCDNAAKLSLISSHSFSLLFSLEFPLGMTDDHHYGFVSHFCSS